ncbi:MAG: hypothetical protein KatS3mg110_4403 [Pirellulaceae bacterium]|nr:MAG: hypothetical protein KatS3mg110_4403 [Pirellulaceae bacterium]
MLRFGMIVGLMALFLGSMVSSPAMACPFCSAVAQTFTEEMDSMDVAVIAKLVEAPKPVGDITTAEQLPKATFVVQDVLKGGQHVQVGQRLEAIYLGNAPVGTAFLMMAVDPPRLSWSTPLAVTARSRQYLKTIASLPRDYASSPEKHAKRLEFFLNYLEDAEEMLARDAYDEFARAPYAVVKLLAPKLSRETLIAWIRNPDVPTSRRRLYFTLLGVCGNREDARFLEELLTSDDPKQRGGLDALIGCYLTLRGADGLPLIEELFLKNEQADYSETYAAIMALRFHGTDGGVIPQQRIVQSLRLMLDRPKLADLVIPDLARWEDWQSMPRLVELFKQSDEKTSWVRVPIINYLRACPLPEAKRYLDELEKLDPVAFRRATTFFPVVVPPDSTSPNP